MISQRMPETREDERLKRMRELLEEREDILEDIWNCFEVLKKNRIVKFSSETRSTPNYRHTTQVQQACDEIIKMEKLLRRISKLVECLLYGFCYDGEAIAAAEHEALAEMNHQLECCAWQAEQKPRRVIKVAALIARVFPKSPAYKADLRAGDFIIQFGPINAFNYGRNPEAFDRIAQEMCGSRIPVKILRNGKELKKKIKPRIWRGCGLLGFQVDRYFAEEQPLQ